MSAKLPADHELARELWANGFSFKDISEKVNVKTGTLAQWKRRERWDCQPRVKHPTEKAGIQAVVEAIGSQTLRIAQTVLNKLENTPPSGIKDCKETATALAATYATARKALGLDDHGAGAGRAINVSIYAQSPVQVQVGSTASDPQSEGQAPKAIDIESVVQPTQELPTTGPTTETQEPGWTS